jgi:hypothetical protein
LSLFTDSVLNSEHKRVPHTRSVYVTSEKRNDVQTPALLLVEGLCLTLHIATPVGEVDQAQLLEEMIRSYAAKYYSTKALTALITQIEDRTKSLEVAHPGLERQWLEAERKWYASTPSQRVATVEEALRATLPTEDQSLFPTLLALLRENQVTRVRLENLEANIALYKEYRLLLKREESVTQVKREIRAENFFFIKSLQEVPVEKSWSLSPKLEKKRVWRATFDNHLVLEHFLEFFRHPMEIDGQFYPTRFEGRKVAVSLLEMDPSGQPRFYEKGRNALSHDYTLRQTVAIRLGGSLLWEFPSHKRQLCLGTLESCFISVSHPDETISTFASLCGQAQSNVGRLSSSRMTVQLGQLGRVVLLLDYNARRKTEEKVVAVSLLDRLDRVPVKKSPPQPSPPGKKKVSLKRRTDEEDEVRSASKKGKYMGKDAPKMLKQASLNFSRDK